jgi:hypothetical protein
MEQHMNLDPAIRESDPARNLKVPAADAHAALAAARAHSPRALRPVRRIIALTAAVTVLTCGVAVAAGSATGVIDLGGGAKAVPGTNPPVPTDSQHPYVYRLTGLPANRDGSPLVYVVSSQPLPTIAPGKVDGAALAQARHLCHAQTKTVTLSNGRRATLWVLDRSCHAAPP